MIEETFVFQFPRTESQRLDHFLVSQMPEHSRSFIQNLIKKGCVKVDGIVIQKSGFKLDKSCAIEVQVPPQKPSDLVPEDIPLDVVFENADVIVVNKSPGMVVHPSAGHDSGTLVHAVLAHAPDIEGVGGVRRPGLVHRLDMDTSGLIILAKNDKTHRMLQAQFKDRQVEKKYIALVDGHPPTPEGRIEAPIGRDPRNRQKMAVTPENKGRMAVSEYRTLEKFDKHALLEVKILTGRTHQIRLHMAFVDCPVVGDVVYGFRNPSLPVKRQQLHAAFLSIKLPGEVMPHRFEAPLPPDIVETLEIL